MKEYQMAKITYDNKEIYTDGSTNSQYFRYQDANEIKNVVNANDTRLERIYELLSQETTQTGTEITIDNTFADNMQLDLKGNLSQYVTTGKNLIDTNNFETINSRGVTISKNDDGSFNIVGTASSSGTIIIGNNFASKLVDGSTYAEYLNEEYGAQLNLYCELGYANSTINLTPTTSRTINTSQYGALNTAYLRLYVTSGNVYNYHNLKIMIAEGTSFTDDDYEPFSNYEASPNPSYPQPIKVVTGDNTITISNADNTENQNFLINLGDLWLGKINDNEDYIYKNNDKWYLKKMTDKVVLKGTETALTRVSSSRYNFVPANPSKKGSSENPNVVSTHYIANYSTNNYSIFASSSAGTISIMDNRFSTLAEYKTWLSANNVEIYYVLNTPTDIEITDTTLINQLEAIQNAQSYDYQTNITQTNAILPFIITATARVERS
jgi:hypothetical protein